MPASIEILTENVDRPLLHARCNSTCGNFFTTAYDATFTPIENVRAFLAAADGAGWVISLLGNNCAAHAKAARDAQSRIVLPGNGLTN
jgi:hypothetical protein